MDEIDEIKMKNAIIESHKEFIEEQRKRYEGFMDEVTDILKCPITMVVTAIRKMIERLKSRGHKKDD